MIKVGIVGGTGYTGVELLRLLAAHPEAQLTAITSRKEDGLPVADMFPSLRGHVDIAWFPLLEDDGTLRWERNPAYRPSELIQKRPEPYPQLGILGGVPIYEQFAAAHDRFLFVSNPALKREEWSLFVP